MGTETWGYDGDTRLTSHNDSLGRVTTDSYDVAGNKTTEVIAVGTGAEATTISQDDKDHHLTKLIDPDSNTTSFAYDTAVRPDLDA